MHKNINWHGGGSKIHLQVRLSIVIVSRKDTKCLTIDIQSYLDY